MFGSLGYRRFLPQTTCARILAGFGRPYRWLSVFGWAFRETVPVCRLIKYSDVSRIGENPSTLLPQVGRISLFTWVFVVKVAFDPTSPHRFASQHTRMRAQIGTHGLFGQALIAGF